MDINEKINMIEDNISKQKHNGTSNVELWPRISISQFHICFLKSWLLIKAPNGWSTRNCFRKMLYERGFADSN